MQRLFAPLVAALILDKGQTDSLRGGAKGSSCEDKAKTLLFVDDTPEGRSTQVFRAPERSLDYCGLKPEAEKKYICSYFEDFVTDAFSHEAATADVSPASFCKVIEAHAGGVEAQAKMFGVLSHYWGLNETESEAPFHDACMADVKKAITPDETVAHDKAADAMYLFCMNYQDCDHHTMAGAGKGCDVQHHNPATGKHLCELLRSDVVKLTVKHPMEAYAPDDLCEWMFRFTDRQARQNEAYRYVMLGEETTPSLIPTVGPAMDALLLSRLHNGAGSHWIRDHQAHRVRRASAALALALGLALA